MGPLGDQHSLQLVAGHSGIVRSALCLPGGRILTAGEAFGTMGANPGSQINSLFGGFQVMRQVKFKNQDEVEAEFSQLFFCRCFGSNDVSNTPLTGISLQPAWWVAVRMVRFALGQKLEMILKVT